MLVSNQRALYFCQWCHHFIVINVMQTLTRSQSSWFLGPHPHPHHKQYHERSCAHSSARLSYGVLFALIYNAWRFLSQQTRSTWQWKLKFDAKWPRLIVHPGWRTRRGAMHAGIVWFSRRKWTIYLRRDNGHLTKSLHRLAASIYLFIFLIFFANKPFWKKKYIPSFLSTNHFVVIDHE